jgi:hypothetical protein
MIALIMLWWVTNVWDIHTYIDVNTTKVTLSLAVIAIAEVYSLVSLSQALASANYLVDVGPDSLALEGERSRVIHHFLIICSLAKF